MTPADWQDDMQLYRGATFNLAHTLGQMLHRRPRNRFEDLEGVYLVGGGTHPGSGLPVIFEGARITAKLLAGDLGLPTLLGHETADGARARRGADRGGRVMRAGAPVGVIGGGLAGLAAAIVLAARGHRVTLLEKNGWLGGKAALLSAEGFRFDMGPTILTLPGVLARVFAEAGHRMEDELDLIRLDPQWRCLFADGSVLDLVEDGPAMAQRLDGFAPGSGAGEGYLAVPEALAAAARDLGALLLLEARSRTCATRSTCAAA